MAIEVRAFREGFYKDKRVRVGEVFDVPDDTAESSWFEPTDPHVTLRARERPTAEKRSEAAEKRREQQRVDAITRAKIAATSAADLKKARKPAPLKTAEVGLTARERAAQQGEDLT